MRKRESQTSGSLVGCVARSPLGAPVESPVTRVTACRRSRRRWGLVLRAMYLGRSSELSALPGVVSLPSLGANASQKRSGKLIETQRGSFQHQGEVRACPVPRFAGWWAWQIRVLRSGPLPLSLPLLTRSIPLSSCNRQTAEAPGGGNSELSRHRVLRGRSAYPTHGSRQAAGSPRGTKDSPLRRIFPRVHGRSSRRTAAALCASGAAT